MTSRPKQCTATLLISGLLVIGGFIFIFLGVLVWLGTNHPHPKSTPSSAPYIHTETSSAQSLATSSPTASTLPTILPKSISINQQQIFANRTIAASAGETDLDYVTPIKTSPQPLHEDDLIYEQSKYGNHRQNGHNSLPTRHSHSGHFRHRTASIWDPHPEYTIHGFGKTFHLVLGQDSNFVSSDILFTHLWSTYHVKVEPAPKFEGCFYSGHVAGDAGSNVVVSLCHGMTGYIRTADTIYYIEPVEPFAKKSVEDEASDQTIVHALHRVNDTQQHNNIMGGAAHTCDTDHGGDTDYVDIVDKHQHKRRHQNSINRIDGPSEDEPLHRTKRSLKNRRKLLFNDRWVDDNGDDDVVYVNNVYDNIQRRRRWRGGSIEPDGSLITYNEHPQNILLASNVQSAPYYDNRNRNQNPVTFQDSTGLVNQEYVVEVLIVADSSMEYIHQTEDNLRHYIFTLMSHVALLFKNDSIGNPIRISVVGIVILKDENIFNNSRNQNNLSEQLLRTFCDWQNNNYTTVRKHDVALLLTRTSICRSDKKEDCNVLGVANEGCMCRSDGCAVVRDTGLSTSFTIAHELGHVLGMPHDNTKPCLKIHKNEQILGIMTHKMGRNSNPWLWSPCAKHHLTEFLESINSFCLLNNADSDLNNEDLMASSPYEIRLPGENISADEQCSLIHGEGFTQCPGTVTCETLHCKAPTGECYWHFHSVADGTSCNVTNHQRGLCVQGECRPIDATIVTPTNGGWSSYGPWGACSMSCGGGIKSARRECNNPRPSNYGKYCGGPAVRYTSCNTQPCPTDLEASSRGYGDDRLTDAREEQCAAFNGNNFNITGVPNDVTWVPKYGQNTCKLYCRVENRKDYYELARKVRDGTKCELNGFNICVNGICRKGGCDNVLDSDVTLDLCGNCGGDNSKCHEIRDSVIVNHNLDGYIDVVTIPKGSYNINVYKKNNPSIQVGNYYYLAVKNESGGYIFNGNYAIMQTRVVQYYGGVTLEYTGSGPVERLNSSQSRALQKQLTIQVLKAGSEPVEVSYSYTILKETLETFVWVHNNWTRCDAFCHGRRVRHPICVERSSHRTVLEAHCSNLVKPAPYVEACNEHCTLGWEKVSFSECSAHCGRGIRHVFIQCVQLMDDGQRTTIDKSYCSHIPRMPLTEVCEGPCDSTHWKYGNYTPCSVSCGKGQKTRSAVCVDNHDRELAPEHCHSEPKVIFPCEVEKCPVWGYRNWTVCSVTCGQGMRKRQVWCHKNGLILSNSACNEKLKPATTEQCDTNIPCHVRWHVSTWSRCSVTCDRGVMTREVYCQDMLTKNIVDDSFCGTPSRPETQQMCTHPSCYKMTTLEPKRPGVYSFSPSVSSDQSFDDITNYITDKDYVWRSGTWSACSVTCGTGFKSRRVYCESDSVQVDDGKCSSKMKPTEQVQCLEAACGEWKTGAWGKCDANCYQNRLVQCNTNQCDISSKPAQSRPCPADECSIHIRHDINNKRKDLPPSWESRVATTTPPSRPQRKYYWRATQWSPCSVSCGKGRRTRAVFCVDSTAKKQPEQYCSHLKRKLKSTSICSKKLCPGFVWQESPWTECSKKCDKGIERRTITCHKVNKYGYLEPEPLRHTHCNLAIRPNEQQPCLLRHCKDIYYWRASEWTPCSQRCGRKGMQRRRLSCIDRSNGDKSTNKSRCPKHLRPERKRKCNFKRCEITSCKDAQEQLRAQEDKEYHMLVHGKNLSIFCHGMKTANPIEYLTLPKNNYAEFYSRRLKNPEDNCPQDEQSSYETNRGGYTEFYRVPLNLTTLRVTIDDFSYVRQHGREKVNFGSAGDCYSQRGTCPKGMFVINLAQTGLEVSRKTSWIISGHNTSQDIRIAHPTHIIGRCGGYCGRCEPDPSVGLLLDVT